MVKRVDRAPAGLDQRFLHELLSSYQSTAVLFAERFQRMKGLAMPVVLAMPAVEVCIPAAAANTEVVALLAVFDP